MKRSRLDGFRRRLQRIAEGIFLYGTVALAAYGLGVLTGQVPCPCGNGARRARSRTYATNGRGSRVRKLAILAVLSASALLVGCYDVVTPGGGVAIRLNRLTGETCFGIMGEHEWRCVGPQR